MPVREWIGLIKSLALLPLELVVLAWNNWLSRIPAIDNPVIHQQLLHFTTYFEETWMNGSWSVQAWNHYDNVWRTYPPLAGHPGPRTTNHAEGWHNRLNHDFGRPHPALNVWLNWLQESNNVNQVRLRDLLNGGLPRNRDPRYVWVDQQIMRAKNILAQQRQRLPVNAGPPAISNECEQYLRYLRHLLG